MLISKTVIMHWNSSNKKWYEDRNYIYTKMKDEFEVKVEDLKKGSNLHVEVECDGCKKKLNNVIWQDYLKCVHTDGKYYCQKCGNKFYAIKDRIKNKLNNGGKSFYDWCIEHNRQDILNRWDYELNKCSPKDITYASCGINRKGYWFKCPKEIHSSELKNIGHFTNGCEGSIDCKGCNSLAQWGYDNVDDKFLEKYWDYEKNIDKNGDTINPWSISYGSKSVVYLYCQIHKYHGSYPITCNGFIRGDRCGYCGNFQVHPLDSLGWLYPEVFSIWSKKNKKSPYEYMPHSNEIVIWTCLEGHNDYRRKVSESTNADFRCPECNCSKGEIKVGEFLKINNVIKISWKDYILLNIIEKINNRYYIPQKEFDELIGLGSGNLSYDFYLPQHNLLIEYQGEQHDYPVDFRKEGMKKAKERFKYQQEHDRRKKQYAINNNIKLLEIWYNCYDDVEFILNEVLKELEVHSNRQEIA